MHINELIKKSRAGDVLSGEELVYLLSLEPDSVETYMVMAEATRLSKELSGGKAEVHAQFAINLAPCGGHGCQAYTVHSLCLSIQVSQPRLAPDERVKANVKPK